jgi:hypothetical protein
MDAGSSRAGTMDCGGVSGATDVSEAGAAGAAAV